MKNCFRQILLLAIVFLLAGCASYSGLVNSFAPERKKAPQPVAAAEIKPSGKSPFCAEPIVAKPVREVYMVMPEDGGKAGTVEVTFKDGESLQLHGDYSAAS